MFDGGVFLTEEDAYKKTKRYYICAIIDRAVILAIWITSIILGIVNLVTAISLSDVGSIARDLAITGWSGAITVDTLLVIFISLWFVDIIIEYRAFKIKAKTKTIQEETANKNVQKDA